MKLFFSSSLIKTQYENKNLTKYLLLIKKNVGWKGVVHNLYRNNIKRRIVHIDLSECVIKNFVPVGSSCYCHYWVEAGFYSLCETVKTWEVAQGMKVWADLVSLRKSLVRACLCFDPTCCGRLPILSTKYL